MNNKTSQYEIIIAGGGMVGMSMAIAVARLGLQVLLLEKAALPSQLEEKFDGRVSAIALGSQKILDGIGAWAGMAAHAEPINDIRVSDGATPFFLHYDHHEVGSDPFGFIVENRYIRHALHKAAQNCSTLSIIDNCTIKNVTQDDNSVFVSLADGSEMKASLLIGADGKNSFIRKLAGIEDVQWNYSQTAIVCTIEHTSPHHGLAQERFLHAGPFAVLPMTENRSSLVWVEPNDRVEIYMELPEEEFVQEITERVGDYLGTIKTNGKRFTYPLSLMHAKKYHAGRIALMGDAAHGIHPIAGQGVNLGFRDVGVLAELIEKQHAKGLDIGAESLLEAYGKWRRFDNVTMLAVTDILNRLFSSNIIPLRVVRDLGLWAVGKMPPLKKLFMRHAMGLVGELPEMVKKKI